MPHRNTPDPRQQRSWQALAPAHKEALIEASGWAIAPHGNPHPMCRSATELLQRAYVAAGYEVPVNIIAARAEEAFAAPASEAGQRFARMQLLLDAARSEAQARLTGISR